MQVRVSAYFLLKMSRNQAIDEFVKILFNLFLILVGYCYYISDDGSSSYPFVTAAEQMLTCNILVEITCYFTYISLYYALSRSVRGFNCIKIRPLLHHQHFSRVFLGKAYYHALYNLVGGILRKVGF